MQAHAAQSSGKHGPTIRRPGKIRTARTDALGKDGAIGGASPECNSSGGQSVARSVQGATSSIASQEAEARALKEPTCEEDPYPRIEPGFYNAYCSGVQIYRDPRFKRRWVCRLDFDIHDEGMIPRRVAQLAQFLNLGNGEKPKAGRGSEYRRSWIIATGGVPGKRQRMSKRVFRRHLYRVEVRDVQRRADGRAHIPAEVYSVVGQIVERVA